MEYFTVTEDNSSKPQGQEVIRRDLSAPVVDEGRSGGEIFSIVLFVLFLVSLAVLLAVFWWRRKNS